MGNDKSKPIDSSTKPKEATTDSRINVPMVQNVLLIWLDGKITDKCNDCRNTITHLRRVVNTIHTFTDPQECMQFLDRIGDEKACIIISGSLGQHLVPRLHNLAQVDSIFIFCRNKNYHEGWANDWTKIKGVFSDITPVCEALKQAAEECEQNAISISIMSSGDGGIEKSGDRLDPSFIYTQIMKEIFLTINFEQQHMNQFIQYCRVALADNDKQLKYVDRLVRKYRAHTPIWWYTCECFLYPMLNRALRAMDVDLMIKLGFFISDLHRHIDQLYQEQSGTTGSNKHFTVYRGQGMDKEPFQKMMANKGGLISFNSFLSTSKKRSTSLKFVQRALRNGQLVGVLFVMNIDPDQSSAPFASVAKVGYYRAKEDEILFSMHSVFRIGEITPMDDNTRLFQVQLNLASDKDNDLRELIDYIRKEIFPDSTGWYRLGLVLSRMGESVKAEQVLETLLEQETDEMAKAPIYHQLGLGKAELGQYAEAITYYEKSLEQEIQQIPRNDRNVASSYHNIGGVYFRIGDYPKAFSFYEKALLIRLQSPTHPHDLAGTFMNIGNVHCSMGDYPKAISSYEDALVIQQQMLPSTHPDLAMSHGNIAEVYKNMGNYSKALSSYGKALAIQQQSLPPTHPNLATSHMNLGNVYDMIGDYLKALASYEKALVIQQQILPSTHPDLAASYGNIGVVYFNIGDYPKALSYAQKALIIQQQLLLPTHPVLGISYMNIGNMYKEMNDYPEALFSYETALAIQQISLPPTHPDLALTYSNMGAVYKIMGDYSKAHLHIENAVNIAQRSLPANHPELLMYRKQLANIKQML